MFLPERLQSLLESKKESLSDPDWLCLREQVHDFFAQETKNVPVFSTNASDLVNLWMKHLPPEIRPIYECRHCHDFITKYGHVAIVDPTTGNLKSPLWALPNAHDKYRNALFALTQAVQCATITGTATCCADDENRGQYFHFYARSTPYPVSSAAHENVKCVLRALDKFKPCHLETLETLFTSGFLPQKDAFLLRVKFLQSVLACSNVNQKWLTIVKAPDAFCHVQSGVIGRLLEDVQLVVGGNFEHLKQHFCEMVASDHYQRPVASPKTGNVAEFSKMLETYRQSFERRFAKIEELELLWSPIPPYDNHIPSNQSRLDWAQNITWCKFHKEILPHATKIMVEIPRVGDFGAITTAVHPHAPAILQWDHEDRAQDIDDYQDAPREVRRNPFSGYVYTGGSRADKWGLVPDTLHEVSGICFKPFMFFGGHYPQHSKGVFLLLQNCRDLTDKPGLALFPSCLKKNFHHVRASVEDYSNTHFLTGAEEATACGISYVNGYDSVHMEVTMGGMKMKYVLDRWD